MLLFYNVLAFYAPGLQSSLQVTVGRHVPITSSISPYFVGGHFVGTNLLGMSSITFYGIVMTKLTYALTSIHLVINFAR